MSGKGSWSDGVSAHKGEWLRGLPQGQRTWMTVDDVELYEGSFVNGQRHGQGRHVCKELGEYNGSWLDNLFCGFGVLKHGDGQVPLPPLRASHFTFHPSHARCRCTTASGRRVGGTAGGASRYPLSRSTTGSGAEGGCGAWARSSELQAAGAIFLSRIAVTIVLLQLLMRCARYSEGVVYKGEMMRDMRRGTGAR